MGPTAHWQGAGVLPGLHVGIRSDGGRDGRWRGRGVDETRGIGSRRPCVSQHQCPPAIAQRGAVQGEGYSGLPARADGPSGTSGSGVHRL